MHKYSRVYRATYEDQPRLSHPPCQFYFDTDLWITLLITCGKAVDNLGGGGAVTVACACVPT
jgi:hypothetical protein